MARATATAAAMVAGEGREAPAVETEIFWRRRTIGAVYNVPVCGSKSDR